MNEKLRNSSLGHLSDEQAQVFQDVWTVHIGLMNKLDVQMRRKYGLSNIEFFTLQNLANLDGGSLRMSALAELTQITLSHLSRLVTRLEDQGYIKRGPDSQDGRSVRAELTAAGRKVLDDASPSHYGLVREIFFPESVDPKQRAAFAQEMARLADEFKRR